MNHDASRPAGRADLAPGFPWPVGSATGIGSLPGTDPAEAIKTVLGDLPDLPYLPELPARGPGAELIGRTAGLLVELPIELYAGQWRVAARQGRDLRRTHDLMQRDLDLLTELAAGFTGTFKVQAAGPWTMAASVDLSLGGRLLRDRGAARDLAESLAEGLKVHVDDVAARLPGAQILLQLDEPSLPAVLAGEVPTESGWQTLRSVDPTTAEAALRTVIETVRVPVVVHCCASRIPVALLASAGATAIAFDLDLVKDLDPIGEAIDAGTGIFIGAVPTAAPLPVRPPASAEIFDKVRAFWRQIGFPDERAARQLVVTPACGLAGAGASYARAALKACREAGQRLADATG